MLAWSYGGGVQSVAIGVLVRRGVLPRPDLAGIADTGREVASTWEYLRDVMAPLLAPAGITVEVVPHSLARVDLCDKGGLTLVPAYTRTEDGVGLFGDMTYREGRLAAFCSGEWKRDVMERWLRSRGVRECDQWIGYSLDEAWRVKKDHRPWCRLRHPLIDLRLTREQCVEVIRGAGLPVPRKSRCWCCPHQTPAEWLEVQARPGEFAAAADLERRINETDPDHGGDLFLYEGRVPLPLADFAADAGAARATPGRACVGGHCWT